MIRAFKTLTALLAVVAILDQPPAPPASASPPTSIPVEWQTHAERTAYRQTADYVETMRYCRRLAKASAWIRLESYGVSGQGRDLPLLILSKDRTFTPEAARATGKPIVLIQNGIHSGEIEGKDASLALLRDIAVLRTHEALADQVILIVLPIFSVDAHERRGPYNRINQNGPEEMGWRSTPVGLNLNRDYLKAESVEMRALLSRVYTRWWPHLLVDNHTTNGAEHRHDVTYAFNHGAGMPPALEAWLEEAFERRVVGRLRDMGHLPAPYIVFKTGNDPASGMVFENSRPRYSTGYPQLHGRAAILVETHMAKPYETRVRATYDLMVALLEELDARPAALPRAVAASESATVARGRATRPNERMLVLQTRSAPRGTPFTYHGFRTQWAMSRISGALAPRYSDVPWDTTLTLYREVEPEVVVQQPVGYLVPREWTVARDRLDVHGVTYHVLMRPYTDSVEVQRVQTWASGTLFEGHRPTTVTGVELERRRRTFRPGDLWVPLDQRSAAVAVHLFEAQAPDGLAHWNYFDTVLEQKEYAEDYVMDPIGEKLMRTDSVLVREFRQKVASDTAFANSPTDRVNYVFNRSPYRDPEQNVLPPARALRRPPQGVLAPLGTRGRR